MRCDVILIFKSTSLPPSVSHLVTADFDTCNNYGNIYTKRERAGGFIALHHSFVVGLEFRNCSNHGKIHLDNSSGYAGGFVAHEDLNLSSTTKVTTVNSYLYNCYSLIN